MNGDGQGGVRLMLRLIETIDNRIAAALQRLGVVGGTKIPGSSVTGTIPAGVALFTVQSEGVTVGARATLNFGPGFLVTDDAVNDRINVDLDPDYAALNFYLIDDAGDVFVDDAGETFVP